MSTLYVVRHGQASFLEEDYDRLSEMGCLQAQLLARHWLAQGLEIDEVYSGELQRQVRTAECVGEVYREAGAAWPPLRIIPGLNEYDADAFLPKLQVELSQTDNLVHTLLQQYREATEATEIYRSFHRLLARIMQYYIDADYESHGFESWRAFHNRVCESFAEIRCQPGRGRRVAVFTSGGPVGVVTQTTLEAPEKAAIDMHWRLHNASVTKFTFRPDRISLDQFNSVPHLGSAALKTYR